MCRAVHFTPNVSHQLIITTVSGSDASRGVSVCVHCSLHPTLRILMKVLFEQQKAVEFSPCSEAYLIVRILGSLQLSLPGEVHPV